MSLCQCPGNLQCRSIADEMVFGLVIPTMQKKHEFQIQQLVVTIADVHL